MNRKRKSPLLTQFVQQSRFNLYFSICANSGVVCHLLQAVSIRGIVICRYRNRPEQVIEYRLVIRARMVWL